MIRSFRARRICGLLHWLFVSLGLVSVGHALPNQLDVEGILLSGIDMKMVDGTCALSSSLYAAEEVVKALCSEGTLTLQSVTGAIRYPWAKELQIDVVDAHGPERSHQSVYSGVSPL
ncbi:MAG TPA: hypothetical protein DCQ06_05350, partial [Myxococcales bacterium]|nr:hypothetical protein [Myxococcales bacterium]